MNDFTASADRPSVVAQEAQLVKSLDQLAATNEYHLWMKLVAPEAYMSEEDLEVLITLDDPGEDDLEEDTFHDHQTENTTQPLTTRHDPRTGVVDKDRS